MSGFYDLGSFRTAAMQSTDATIALVDTIKKALEGDSNDAEHDALVDVAQFFGIGWVSDYVEERYIVTLTVPVETEIGESDVAKALYCGVEGINSEDAILVERQP
jgi:hypothetical protein